MKKTKECVGLILLALMVLVVYGCGGGGDDTARYQVSGTVTGLQGTLVLQNNGGGNLTIASDGTFTFSTRLAVGEAYSVKVAQRPGLQDCVVANSTGVMGATGVTDITVTCADALVFIGNDGSGSGWEYWRLNTITDDMSMISDLDKGGSSNPSNFVEFNGKIYFSAYKETTGTELWSYDGVTASLVADINSGTGCSSPTYLTVYNNKLYFSASDSHDLSYTYSCQPTNNELWSYDGVNPPQMVADINDAGSSYPSYLTVYNSKLYFSATDGSSGMELWSYDGADPPVMVADINSGSGYGRPSYLTVFNNKLYFSADDGVIGGELWSYDGVNPPQMAADINGTGGSWPANLAVNNNKLYFSAYLDATGRELWSYDGVNAALVAEINIGTGGSYPSSLTVYNNKLYFSASDNDDGWGPTNSELWSYDGVNPPQLVADINAGGSSDLSYLTVYNNKLYFSAADCVAMWSRPINKELWSYDGVNPPQLAADIYSGAASSSPSFLALYNNKLYFSADGGANGVELWEYNGANATQAADINSEGSGMINPWRPVRFNGKLYFPKFDFEHGDELWSYDGLNPPQLVADIENGQESSSPSYLTVYNDKLYFGASQGDSPGLWSYDGVNPPQRVSELLYVSNFPVVYAGKLYFPASDYISGYELWSYDGVTATLVADINIGTGGSQPSFLTVYNDKLYFTANDGVNGGELWSYDGSSAALVANIDAGAVGSWPVYLTVYNNKLYFGASGSHDINNYPTNSELWSYDGVNPPQPAADINAGGNSDPSYLTVCNNKLYFTANNGSDGKELWSYDGVNPPAMVADIYPGINSGNPNYMRVINNTLYFNAVDGATGMELWKYDGTNPPSIIKDLWPATAEGVTWEQTVN